MEFQDISNDYKKGLNINVLQIYVSMTNMDSKKGDDMTLLSYIITKLVV